VTRVHRYFATRIREDSQLTDFLEEKRSEIRARLKELKPLVEEYGRLEAAEQALSGVGANPASAPAKRARRSAKANGAGRRRGGGRPKGSGTRGTQALELVRGKPGITIPELAEAMEIQQNYLYRVMPDLSEQGRVVKSGRGWHVRQ
jgi:sugar-specific transcriptional regulator TrmB